MPEPSAPGHLRLFLAIEIPDQIRTAIAGAQQAFRHAFKDSRVTWTRPEQFHVTLKFLGRVDASECGALKKTVAQTCAEFQPLTLFAEGVGFFPRPQSPRVVWVGVRESANTLAELHRKLEEATQPFTAEEPEARFHSHITLGRVKGFSRSDAAELAHAAKALSARDFGDWTASEVVLMQSKLSPQGAVYSAIARAPFII